MKRKANPAETIQVEEKKDKQQRSNASAVLSRMLILVWSTYLLCKMVLIKYEKQNRYLVLFVDGGIMLVSNKRRIEQFFISFQVGFSMWKGLNPSIKLWCLFIVVIVVQNGLPRFLLLPITKHGVWILACAVKESCNTILVLGRFHSIQRYSFAPSWLRIS